MNILLKFFIALLLPFALVANLIPLGVELLLAKIKCHIIFDGCWGYFWLAIIYSFVISIAFQLAVITYKIRSTKWRYTWINCISVISLILGLLYLIKTYNLCESVHLEYSVICFIIVFIVSLIYSYFQRNKKDHIKSKTKSRLKKQNVHSLQKAELLEALSNNDEFADKVIAVEGINGIGKSILLDEIRFEWSQQKDHIVSYISVIQYQDEKECAKKIYQSFIEELKKDRIVPFSLNPFQPLSELQNAKSRIFQIELGIGWLFWNSKKWENEFGNYLKIHNIQYLLILDEYDRLLPKAKIHLQEIILKLKKIENLKIVIAITPDNLNWESVESLHLV